MLSPEYQQVRATLVNDRGMLDVPLAVQRQEWEAAAAQAVLPPSITIRAIDAQGVAGEWVSSPDIAAESVLLFLHGGGYTAGSCRTHREIAARLCLASGAQVLLIDYRLAPEHSFPAALDDAVASYQWLLARGIVPERIIIGGDSAGGGLALATLLWIRQHHHVVPAAGVVLSPWVDLALTGPSLQTHAAVDPLCSREGLALAAAAYLAGADATTPFASPLYADLHGLPPLLIHVGGDEVLLSDATRLAEQAKAAGVEVTLDIWEGLWHVWHAWAGVLPEGQQAIARIGVFIREHLARREAA